MNFFVLGVHHTTAPVEVRERFAIPESRLPEALAKLTSMDGIDEGMIVAPAIGCRLPVKQKQRTLGLAVRCRRDLAPEIVGSGWLVGYSSVTNR